MILVDPKTSELVYIHYSYSKNKCEFYVLDNNKEMGFIRNIDTALLSSEDKFHIKTQEEVHSIFLRKLLDLIDPIHVYNIDKYFRFQDKYFNYQSMWNQLIPDVSNNVKNTLTELFLHYNIKLDRLSWTVRLDHLFCKMPGVKVKDCQISPEMLLKSDIFQFKHGDIVSFNPNNADSVNATIVSPLENGYFSVRKIGDTGKYAKIHVSNLKATDIKITKSETELDRDFKICLDNYKTTSSLILIKNEYNNKILTFICSHCNDKLTLGMYGNALRPNLIICEKCNQSYIAIHVNADDYLVFKVFDPKKNKINTTFMKTCYSCGLFEFEYSSQGKRCTGYCQMTNQCVLPNNYCDKYFPLSPEDFKKRIGSTTANLNSALSSLWVSNRTPNELKFTEEDKKESKKQMNEIVNKYELDYNTFIRMLVIELRSREK